MSLSFRTKVNAGFFPAFVFLAVISFFGYRNISLLVNNASSVTHTHEVIEATNEALSELKDLETGQRGYLITGKDTYLDPFQNALSTVDGTLDQLQKLTSDNESQQRRITQLKELKNQKVEELKRTILLRKEQGFEAARSIVLGDVGKITMDHFRSVANEMKNEENRLLSLRNEKVDESTQLTVRVIVIGGLLSILVLLAATVIVNRAENERILASRKLQDQNRIRSGLIQLNEKTVGDQSVTALAKNVIETLSNFIGAKVGAVYLADDAGILKWAGGYGFQQKEDVPIEFRPGDGLIGQAAAQKTPIVVSDVPNHYLKVHSALGEAQPNSIHVLPFLHDGKVKGVTELGTFASLSEADTEYLKLGLESIAIAFNSAEARTKIMELLEETQSQSEELQVQQEELKAANEELQTKTQELETQQEELKQTNEELEEQRSTLEEQTERLEETNREIQKARVDIEEKATEVERASQYKSEFLANMSHELRTPLNSILLLSKSLTENTDGNLTKDQEEICGTIHSSGVDLLNLISDILDLSKVEAGKLDVKVAKTEVSELAGAMENLFRHQMESKGLALFVEVSKTCPKTIFTDRFRLEQILKNFLSNSLKFTEKGKIVLSFELPKKESGFSIAIAVTDTGIGIPADKTKKIFETFEQIDSTSSRKYGGAGLGLAIAKKLSHLLGGEIEVESNEGKGSRFVVFLPERLEKEMPLNVGHDVAPPIRVRAHGIEDDRKTISSGDRTILIIEDDPNFAKILYGYCRDRGFKCLMAADGEAGLRDAAEFLPRAIILDLRLPAMSGMTVLGSLKGNAKTRHIPVHVMSVDERASDVLKMGAIGFLTKPTTQEGIEAALRKIEDKISSRARKVLLVEDKKVERESILRLIGDGDVKSFGVDSGQEALKRLKAETFDCMILDLKLPDMTGFELLEKIENTETLSRPPVIVYTGRDLTKNEIEKLSHFSESIIIKGARSEERLLDELTLFLHHVESELPKEKRQILERVRHREEIFEGKKLLVVDDDMRNVFALRNILSKKGVEILVGKTGNEAIEKLQAHPNTDLVLMDIMMPEMDGYEAMRHIRKERKFEKLPIIALTAKAMAGDREKCLEAGASDYLPKPIDMDHLLSLLRVWLTR